MRVIIASDSFKGTNSSLGVASTIEKGLKKVFPDADCLLVSVADGGEGTVESVLAACNGEEKKIQVTGPLGDTVEAFYGYVPSEKTAVIEMAAASGLPMIPKDQRDPRITTTFGTGQLIKAALDDGCKKIVIGIGGSGTNDGGVGMAQALGYSFKDASGNELPYGGAALTNLASIDASNRDKRLDDISILIACDVKNPLLGEKGASFIYGPQKGATPEVVKELDSALANLAKVEDAVSGEKLAETPGAGAAGGLGFGLLAFCNAKMASGINTVLDTIGFDALIKGADLVITGEGRLDGQSVYGKVPVGISERAKAQGIPVLAMVGDLGDNACAVYDYGIDSLMSTVNRAMPLETALAESVPLLEDASERAMRMVRIGMSLKA